MSFYDNGVYLFYYFKCFVYFIIDFCVTSKTGFIVYQKNIFNILLFLSVKKYNFILKNCFATYFLYFCKKLRFIL